MADSVRVTIYPEITEDAKLASLSDREDIAHQIVGLAQAAAPVKSGRFKAGMTVEVGSQVEVVDNDPDAGWKEYGTSFTAAHATLTSAASQFGRYSGIKPRGGISAGVSVVAGRPSRHTSVHRRGRGR